jgi:hypothetical protein
VESLIYTENGLTKADLLPKGKTWCTFCGFVRSLARQIHRLAADATKAFGSVLKVRWRKTAIACNSILLLVSLRYGNESHGTIYA